MTVISSPEEGECVPNRSKNNQIEELASFAGKSVSLGKDFSVRRVLPNAKQRSVGPFVFFDHFGPSSIEEHAMNVGPHPHIGLMTISYLYEGAILHRDSTGAEQMVPPGEVNGMISGNGVTHSERGELKDIKPHLDKLNRQLPLRSHGLQLWMALSKEGEDVDPSFHHAPSVPVNENASLVVGKTKTHHQTNIPIDPHLGKVVFLDIQFFGQRETFEFSFVGGLSDVEDIVKDPSIELGVYVSTGKIALQSGWGSVDGRTVESGNMTVVKIPNNECFRGSLQSLTPDTRVAVLGGTALPEKRYMFWNFVATSRDKVEQAAQAWDRLDRAIFPEVVNEDNKDSIPLPKRKN
ncbi:pirin-like protein [Nitzschia inconspicua]|uniref:Pirin-like protein n=1 Tax=Nitzschia inconspicua TaxID=303405 RepID=A0A9K3L5V9_9STRA|nr:pirin-like protein [Nitzschia inconspicua]